MKQYIHNKIKFSVKLEDEEYFSVVVKPLSEPLARNIDVWARIIVKAPSDAIFAENWLGRPVTIYVREDKDFDPITHRMTAVNIKQALELACGMILRNADSLAWRNAQVAQVLKDKDLEARDFYSILMDLEEGEV